MAKGHIRARGPGTWELKFDVGVDAKSGKRITKFRTVRGSKRDAQRELRNILTAINSGTLADAGKATVGGWLQTWLAEAKHNVAPKTLQRYREIVDLHLTQGPHDCGDRHEIVVRTLQRGLAHAGSPRMTSFTMATAPAQTDRRPSHIASTWR